MDKSQTVSSSQVVVWGLAAVFLWVFADASTASAQFGLPKVPKILKKGEKKDTRPEETKRTEAKRPEAGKPCEEITPSGEESAGTPEIGAEELELMEVTPDSAPPGGYGQLVLTGKNFICSLPIRISCRGDVNPAVQSLKVEAPGRAVARIKVPLDVKEGPCSFLLPGGGDHVVRFQISIAGKMPMRVPAMLLGEGELDFMQAMMRMSEEGMEVMKSGGYLELTADSVKFVQEGFKEKVAFTEPTSAVKEVEGMTQMGESTGMFRITFRTGKIYNFMATGSGEEGDRVVSLVKKRLGK